ncbi:Alpha/Beta hydrolase fold [Naviculisporaceae sp. PSN 640]
MAKPTPPRYPILSYQPLRLVFQLVYIGSIVARLPLWLTVSLLPSLRPHPKWNGKQTFLSRVAHALVDLKSYIGISDPITLEAGAQGDRFQVIEPFPAEFYTGPLTRSPTIKPEPVGGTWCPQRPSASSAPAGITMLYLHGGAYIQGDGRDDYCGYPNRTIPKLGVAQTVFSLQYRLSGYGGQNPFPAALQDALTAYLFLLRIQNVPASRIVICGDSAGGNLAIALLRYLVEYGAALDIPMPRCATLFSPWVNLFAFNFNSSNSAQWNSDFLPNGFLKWGAETYSTGVANPEKDSYITPLGNPFATTVPVFVNVGTAEIFVEAVREWVGQMKAVNGGNRIEYKQEDAAPHDTFLLADKLCFEESAEEVLIAAKEFIERSG